MDGACLKWNPEDQGPDSLLGKGAFGSVYRGTLAFTEVAIKVIERVASDKHEHELRLMKRLVHPHIVQFLGTVRDTGDAKAVIVTELMHGGSLQSSMELMRTRTPDGHGGTVVAESCFLRIGGQIGQGLLYLHNAQYTHGDMKPHNIVLNSPVEFTGPGGSAVFHKTVCAKIADFGLSRYVGRKADDLLAATNTPDFGPGPVGTFAYMAPEAFDGIAAMTGDIAKAADVYALGTVLFELLTGREPWQSDNVRSVFNLYHLVYTEERRPAWGPRKASIRQEYVDFVKKCWAQDWKARPTSEAVAKQFCVWLEDFKRRESTDSSLLLPENPLMARPPVGSGDFVQHVGSYAISHPKKSLELPVHGLQGPGAESKNAVPFEAESRSGENAFVLPEDNQSEKGIDGHQDIAKEGGHAGKAKNSDLGKEPSVLDPFADIAETVFVTLPVEGDQGNNARASTPSIAVEQNSEELAGRKSAGTPAVNRASDFISWNLPRKLLADFEKDELRAAAFLTGQQEVPEEHSGTLSSAGVVTGQSTGEILDCVSKWSKWDGVVWDAL